MAKLTPIQQAAAIAGIIGASAGVIGLFKWSSSSSTTTVTQQGSGFATGRDTIFNGPVQLGTESSRQIQLSCEWSQLPKIVPQNGLSELELIANKLSGFVSSSSQPGTAIDMLSSGQAPPYAYLCRFSNLGTVPVLNFETELKFFFMKVVQEEHGIRSGEMLDQPHGIKTPPTSLGGGDKFEFYVRNYSPFFAEVVLPEMARDRVVGNDPGHNFELIPTQRNRFSMPPFVR
jgi:hypothetical protein